MKKFLFAILAVGVMASCAKDNGGGQGGTLPVGDDDEVAMSSGVIGPKLTRGPIESTNPGNLPTKEQRIHFLRPADAAASSLDWTAAGIAAAQADGKSMGLVGAVMSTNGRITFTKPGDKATEVQQFYNSNGALSSAFLGFNQYNETTSNITHTAGQAPVITWAIDGKSDYIVADVVAATKAIKKETVAADRFLTPNFKHLLTRLEFLVIAEDESTQDTWGKIKAITVKDTPTSMTYALAPFTTANPNTPTWGATGDVLTWVYTDATDSDAQVDPAVGVALPNDADSEEAAYFSYAMLQPDVESYSILIESEKQADRTIAVKLTDGTKTKPGSFHQITLTFSSLEIDATATISRWESGTGGNIGVD